MFRFRWEKPTRRNTAEGPASRYRRIQARRRNPDRPVRTPPEEPRRRGRPDDKARSDGRNPRSPVRHVFVRRSLVDVRNVTGQLGRVGAAITVGLALVAMVFAASTATTAGATAGPDHPVFLWLQVSRRSVPYTGGSVWFIFRVQHSNECRLAAAGAGAGSVTVPVTWRRCSNGIYLAQVAFGANSAPAARLIAFRAYLRRGTAIYWEPLGSIRVDGAPRPANPSTPLSTNVAMSLTSSAAGNRTTSELVEYSASLSATCQDSDGDTLPCPVPTGTVSWMSDGADLRGNLTSQSSPIPTCGGAVGSANTEGTCDVTFGAYGDEWVSAVYTSASASSVTRTLEVQLEAPVDLGAGLAYSGYGNVGPDATDDCTMASVADWIETSLGTVPDYQETVDAYWQAEKRFNGGEDVGLNVRDLLTFWQDTGIDGTYLTDATPLSSDAEIETYLSGGHALIADATLPKGFPPGQPGGGHQWLIVGYSSFGPMIVTWGQELQLSWARFDRLTWSEGGDALAVAVRS